MVHWVIEYRDRKIQSVTKVLPLPEDVQSAWRKWTASVEEKGHHVYHVDVVARPVMQPDEHE